MGTDNETWTWVIRSNAEKPYSVYCDAFLIKGNYEERVSSGIHINLNNLAILLSIECTKRNLKVNTFEVSWLDLTIDEGE